MDHEINSSAVSAVIQALYWTGVVKRELSWKAKLSIYQFIHLPEIWVVTQRLRL